ncbi:superfamily II DNA/RNA helicases SNF2 family, partial [Candidatus Termititenax dinenymphae]
KPALVVVPRSVLENWEDELARFAPGLQVLSLHGTQRHSRRAEIAGADVLLTTYDTLDRDYAEHYVDPEFGYVILDEAQKIKNAAVSTSQTVRKLNSANRLIITGTPIENDLDDIWTLFDFIMPGYLGDSAKELHERYDNDLEDLRRRIYPFILRRQIADVKTDMPKKEIADIYYDASAKQAAAYQQFKTQLKDDVEHKKRNYFESLLLLRQFCLHPALLGENFKFTSKYEQFKKLVAEKLAKGEKVVIFSQYREMLDIIAKELGVKYARVDGGVLNRKAEIDRFNNDPEVKIFLATTGACNSGVNLHYNCNNIILYDNWWNEAVDEQAIGRVYRVGQTKPVNVYRFITKDTVEVGMIAVQKRKQGIINAVLSVDSLAGKDLSGADFGLTEKDLQEIIQ